MGAGARLHSVTKGEMTSYHSPSTIIRNLSELTGKYKIVYSGEFSVAHFDAPFFNGFEFWVISAKGFLWEGFNDFQTAVKYAEKEEKE
jgi:hypothetical protein